MTDDRHSTDGGEPAPPIDVERAGDSPPDPPTNDGLDRELPDLLGDDADVGTVYMVRAGLSAGSGRSVGERLVDAMEDKVTVVGTTLDAGFDPANPELDVVIETDHDHGAVARSLSSVGPVEGVVVADVSEAAERALEDGPAAADTADANDVFNELKEEVGQEGYGQVVEELEDVSFPGGPDPDEEVDLQEEVGVDLEADPEPIDLEGDGDTIELDDGGDEADDEDEGPSMKQLLGEEERDDDGDVKAPDEQAIEDAISDVELDGPSDDADDDGDAGEDEVEDGVAGEREGDVADESDVAGGVVEGDEGAAGGGAAGEAPGVAPGSESGPPAEDSPGGPAVADGALVEESAGGSPGEATGSPGESTASPGEAADGDTGKSPRGDTGESRGGDTGEPPGDGSAGGGPATTGGAPGDMDAFVADLVAALESGAVGEERRTELREALGIESTHSLDVRLEYLQKRVDNLAAYTDAWEAFLSEQGSGREFMESVRDDLDALEGRLAELEGGGAGGPTGEQLGAIEGRLTDLEETLRSLEGRQDDEITRLDTRVDDVESRLEGRLDAIEDAVGTLKGKVDKLLQWREHIDDVLGSRG